MLAMDDETPRGIRQPALSLTTIASMLAPTEFERCFAQQLSMRNARRSKRPSFSGGHQ
jgi:hypothetical protein